MASARAALGAGVALGGGACAFRLAGDLAAGAPRGAVLAGHRPLPGEAALAALLLRRRDLRRPRGVVPAALGGGVTGGVFLGGRFLLLSAAGHDRRSPVAGATRPVRVRAAPRDKSTE